MSIAVLLPHYKNIGGLRITLNSLITESQYFEVFLVDDGSKQDVEILSIVESSSLQDQIHIYLREDNGGITNALNFGIDKILECGKFKYIARIDAGDINLADRFKKQFDFLERNASVYLLGSYVRFVNDKHDEMFVFRPVSEPSLLKKYIHVYNPFIHPAVMFRIECVNEIGYYPSSYPALEDHAYFMMISKRFDTKVLEEILLEYEINPEGISQSKRSIQTSSRIKLFKKYFHFGFFPIYGLFRAYFTHLLSPKILNKVKVLFFQLKTKS